MAFDWKAPEKRLEISVSEGNIWLRNRIQGVSITNQWYRAVLPILPFPQNNGKNNFSHPDEPLPLETKAKPTGSLQHCQLLDKNFRYISRDI
jgi:hypothetical protein